MPFASFARNSASGIAGHGRLALGVLLAALALVCALPGVHADERCGAGRRWDAHHRRCVRQPLSRPSSACATGEHRSGGHCCGAGLEWVTARSACWCLEPGGCGVSPVPVVPVVPAVPVVPVAPVAPAVPVVPVAPAAIAATCPSGMVQVPGATFRMGSTAYGESPVHEVTVSAFCMDRTEVTVGAYFACASNGACAQAPTTATQDSLSPYCNASRADRREHPVNCVDWSMAETYCSWRGARLPTESEWEFAARGTDERAYPWGRQAPGASLLNVCGAECRRMIAIPGHAASVTHAWIDDWASTSPVGRFPSGASPFGLLDMAGNVAEWTSDWYGGYPSGAATNPAGARTGVVRAIRGGGWYDFDGTALGASSRATSPPESRDSQVGFRCARAIPR